MIQAGQLVNQSLATFIDPNLFTLKLELYDGDDYIVEEPILHFWPIEPFAQITFPDGRIVGMRLSNISGYRLTPYKKPE